MRQYTQAASRAQTGAYSEGLRQYMLQVYNYMASGIFLTAIISYFTANTPALLQMFYKVQDGHIAGMTPLGWIVAFAPIGVVLMLGFKAQSMSPATARSWFWGYAALMGLSLASIFLMYTGASIARTLFVTAGVFGAMSLYGYTTKKDLTSWGSFLFMGVIGVLIAGIVNIFLQSSMLYFITSVIGVFLAVGLTAYDTQKVKAVYFSLGDQESAKKMAVLGALTLYIDFVYLFIHLLQFFGQRRD